MSQSPSQTLPPVAAGRQPLTVRYLAGLGPKGWLALGLFLTLTLVLVPVLHLAVPEASPLHLSDYYVTLGGKIMDGDGAREALSV